VSVVQAWLTLILDLRWQLRTKAVAALPGLATVVMALAVAVTIGDAERGQPSTDDAAGGRRVVCSLADGDLQPDYDSGSLTFT
jgi:hypothetical protein